MRVRKPRLLGAVFEWQRLGAGCSRASLGTVAYGDKLQELVEGDPTRLRGPVVTEAAQAGDTAAIEMFLEIGGWLGTGMANLVAAFDPEIVVGGGVSDAGDLLLDPAREMLSRKLTGRGFRPQPPIVKAELGPDAGFIGAADLAREALRDGRI